VIFETGIHTEILYYFIYPALFRIMVCPKGFLLWPLVGIEKVGIQSSGLSGYSVGSHLYIFGFVIFTGCGPLTLSWYRLSFVSDLSIHG
jgi:hypothetical protein